MPSPKAKKSYLLRINADILDAMNRWSDDELRSLNAQIEYVLRDALRRPNRLREHPPPITHTAAQTDPSPEKEKEKKD